MADPATDRAVALMMGGQFEAAEGAMRALLHDRPDETRLHFLVGLAIHKQQRYAEARRWYDAVIDAQRSTPELDTLPHFLGWALYYLGLPDEARVSFAEHLRRVGDEPDSLFAIGLIALEEDRMDEAEEMFIRSIKAIAPTAPSAVRDAAKAHVRLSDVYIRLERLDEAERHLKRGLELYPDHYEGWAKLSRLLHRLGRSDAAAEAQREHDEAMRRVGRG